MPDMTTITPGNREKICRAVSCRFRYIDAYINELRSRCGGNEAFLGKHRALDILRPYLEEGDKLIRDIENFLLRNDYNLSENSPVRWLDRHGTLVFDHMRKTQEHTKYDECQWFPIVD